MAADDDPAYRRINSGVERWSTSVTRMTDNFLDIAHFPWVHAGTFGIQDQRAVPPVELEQLAFDEQRQRAPLRDGGCDGG